MGGEELRGEAELGLFKAGVHEDFRDVAVIEDGVRGEVFGDLAEAGLEAGFAAGAADTAFGVADDARGTVDDTGPGEGREGEAGSGGIAAWVRDEAGVAGLVAVEFGDGVDGLGEEVLGGVLFLVPAEVAGSVAEAEGGAEIDDTGAGVEDGAGQLHGYIVGCGEEDDGEAFGLDRFGGGGGAGGAFVAAGEGAVLGIGAVFEEDGLGVGVMFEDADEFGTGVAAEADDASAEVHDDYLFTFMNNYTTGGEEAH